MSWPLASCIAVQCIAAQLSSFEAEIWSWWKGHRLRWEGTKGGQCRSQWRGSKKLGISKVAPAFSQNIYILLDLIGFCSLTSHSSDLSLLVVLFKPLWPAKILLFIVWPQSLPGITLFELVNTLPVKIEVPGKKSIVRSYYLYSSRGCIVLYTTCVPCCKSGSIFGVFGCWYIMFWF